MVVITQQGFNYKYWSVSSARSECLTVDQEDMGSNPIRTADKKNKKMSNSKCICGHLFIAGLCYNCGSIDWSSGTLVPLHVKPVGVIEHKFLSKRISNKRHAIYSRDGYKCLKCGQTDINELSLDHVIPKSKGGSNDEHNLQTLCRCCNSRKGDQAIDYRSGQAVIIELPVKKLEMKVA